MHPHFAARSLSVLTLPPLFTSLLLAVPAIAQATWLNVSPLKGPSARSEHAMAYDANRGVVVLFGGQTGSSRSSDTWEWDGYLWTQKTPTSRPPARSMAAMAYDAKRKKILLFGGYTGQTQLADTWEWDGLVWSRKSPTSNPPPRYGHAMSYDADRGVIVMFGGYNNSTREQFDTWEWNGATWVYKKLASTVSPTARYLHGMAYDAARKRTLMFGGRLRNGSPDTWQWNGSAWARRSPSTSPSGPYNIAMAYDSARSLVVSFGGNNTNKVYEWDGGEWAPSNVKNPPSGRSSHAMAYDSKRRRMVLFGGTGTGGVSSDTWELVHDCVLVGDGHPGGGLPITCLTPPLLGSNLRLAFAAAQRSGILFVGAAPVKTPWLQAPPPLVCRPGTMWAAPLLTIPGSGSPVILNLAIPNNPQLLDVRVTFQGAAPQLSGCMMLTDAVEVAIR